MKTVQKSSRAWLQAMLDLLATLDRLETRWESYLQFPVQVAPDDKQKKTIPPWNISGWGSSQAHEQVWGGFKTLLPVASTRKTTDISEIMCPSSNEFIEKWNHALDFKAMKSYMNSCHEFINELSAINLVWRILWMSSSPWIKIWNDSWFQLDLQKEAIRSSEGCIAIHNSKMSPKIMKWGFTGEESAGKCFPPCSRSGLLLSAVLCQHRLAHDASDCQENTESSSLKIFFSHYLYVRSVHDQSGMHG